MKKQFFCVSLSKTKLHTLKSLLQHTGVPLYSIFIYLFIYQFISLSFRQFLTFLLSTVKLSNCSMESLLEQWTAAAVTITYNANLNKQFN